MGILARFGDIMRANINDLLTGAENKNAEKLLNQYLRDAREDYAQVRNETASVMAEETAAKRRLDELNDQMARYERYAQAAVQSGNDADALKFLEAKGQLQAKKEDAETAYAQAQVNSEHMRQMTKKLLADIQEAESKIGELKAKLRIAESKEKMQQLTEKIGGKSALGNFDSLADNIQKRIDAADAKEALDAEFAGDRELDDLEKKYAGTDGGPSAQSELEVLKARMGMTPAAGTASSDAAAQLAAMKAQMGATEPAGSTPPTFRCNQCGWTPADPAAPPKFCPQCGNIFDDEDRI
ncbi:MAG TPA: PspA/IM30 family protein [Candidatus Faecousia intestinigallinarum]|nr:PspA/IM30 family protein [Candidatus Faecousia intestinigallinarum]